MTREDRVVGRVSRSKLKLGLGAMRGRLADGPITSVRGNIKVCARVKLARSHENKKRKRRGKEGREEGKVEEES